MSGNSDDSASFKKYENDKEENYMEGDTVLAKTGDVLAIAATTTSTQTLKNQTSIHETDSFDLPEDVYAFMFVCPVFSVPFIFSIYVFATKIIVMYLLYSDINYSYEESGSKTSFAAKFFLIPVALSMQVDLMQVFFGIANMSYSPEVLKVSSSATKQKLLFSYLLRLVDGTFSLAVNFKLMQTADVVLNVFTNFAALYFLQDIDDVFYGLVEMGLFGDGMEHWSTVCKSISLPRRTGADNKLFGCLRMNHLDSGMWLICFIILLFLYFRILYLVHYYYGGFQCV